MQGAYLQESIYHLYETLSPYLCHFSKASVSNIMQVLPTKSNASKKDVQWLLYIWCEEFALHGHAQSSLFCINR